jgi:N-acetylglucosaminyl-diphospho-decaprenol L-rhamnosyltransferase
VNSAERITVSVVSGRNPELVREFLMSLYASTTDEADFHVVVTINGPDEGLRQRVVADASGAGWVERVKVHTNERPLGFAANHNRAVREHRADYYLICNDDVVVLPGAIRSLLTFMRDPNHAHVGVASPLLLNEDRTVQGSTYSFPSPTRVFAAVADLRASRVFRAVSERAARRAGAGRSRSWAHDRTLLVDSVRGAFVLVRNSAIEDAGLMDEIALVGGEEIEWHRRMLDKGWRVAFVHDAAVVHLGSQTVGSDPALRVEFAKGWLNYFQRHGRRTDVLALRTGLAAIYGARYLTSLLSSDEAVRRASMAGFRLTVRWPAIWDEAVSSGRISLT